MKFGKDIQTQQSLFPGLHFLDYKSLKKAIRSIDEAFESLLRNELLHCNVSFRAAGSAIRQGLESLKGEIGKLSPKKNFLIRSLLPQMIGDMEISFRHKINESIVQVEGLRKFGLWNATGLVKILKKRRKGLGEFSSSPTVSVLEFQTSEILVQQDFFSSPLFDELKDLCDSLSRQLDDIVMKTSTEKQVLQKCPICEKSCHDPIKLSCAHTFCWNCFVKASSFESCPTCGAEQKLDPSLNFQVGQSDTLANSLQGPLIGRGIQFESFLNFLPENEKRQFSLFATLPKGDDIYWSAIGPIGNPRNLV